MATPPLGKPENTYFETGRADTIQQMVMTAVSIFRLGRGPLPDLESAVRSRRENIMLPVTRFFLICTFLLLMPSRDTSADVILQPTDSQDYTVSLNGAPYLALHRDADKKWRLTPVTINVTQVDPDLVRIDSPQPKTLALLKHPALRPGPVRVASMLSWSYENDVKPSEVRERHIREIDDLVTVKLGNSVAGFSVKAGGIQLEVDGRSLTFIDSAPEHYSFSMLWAGDLDSDNKIDWLLEIGDEKSSRLCAYLSSAAKPGEFVVEVGCMIASG